MSLQTSKEEYAQALRMGEKEYNERVAAGKDPDPAVLDELVPDIDSLTVRDLGLLEIPT